VIIGTTSSLGYFTSSEESVRLRDRIELAEQIDGVRFDLICASNLPADQNQPEIAGASGARHDRRVGKT
jgi:hypothetical protein